MVFSLFLEYSILQLCFDLPQKEIDLRCRDSNESESVLTAEVEVDAGGDLSILVLGFHFVKSSVRLDDIIEFQNHRVLVPPVLVHADPRPVVLHNGHVLTEPNNLRLWTESSGSKLVFRNAWLNQTQ